MRLLNLTEKEACCSKIHQEDHRRQRRMPNVPGYGVYGVQSTVSLVVIHNLVFSKSRPDCWISNCNDASFRIKWSLDCTGGRGLLFTLFVKEQCVSKENFF